MSNRWKQSKAFWARFYFSNYIVPGGIILGIILLFLFLCYKLSDWVINLALWEVHFLEWLQTATIGEVVLLFGGILLIIRFLTTPSVTVKKEG